MRFSFWLLISAFQLFSASAFVFAQPQQSENFRITKSVLDAGGGVSTSANFRLVSAFGQPSPLGTQTSANFALVSGFLSPRVQLSPLSPVTALVIQKQNLDAYLSWQPVAEAEIYHIYRAATPVFTPGPGTLVGSTAGTSFTDAGVLGGTAQRNYYIITADHGTSVAARNTEAPPPEARDSKRSLK